VLRDLLSLAAALAVLSCAARAGAYCRTTTADVPPGYDPTATGCITEGTPVSWTAMPVSYELHQTASKQVSLAQAAPIFDAAFASWRTVSCSTGNGAPTPPSLSFTVLAPTSAEFVQCPADAQACQVAEAKGPHQILFRDDAWPYDDTANTIALTTVTFGVDTGEIFSANMEINSHDFRFSTADSPPSGEYALAAVARHEAGHFIGLAHSQVRSATMYAFYTPSMTTLTSDDIEGVCAIYPPGHGCSCAMEGRTSGTPAIGAVAVVLAAAGARRRRTAARRVS
jgi:MYXO-CTERM domain-containing protein